MATPNSPVLEENLLFFLPYHQLKNRKQWPFSDFLRLGNTEKYTGKYTNKIILNVRCAWNVASPACVRTIYDCRLAFSLWPKRRTPEILGHCNEQADYRGKTTTGRFKELYSFNWDLTRALCKNLTVRLLPMLLENIYSVVLREEEEED